GGDVLQGAPAAGEQGEPSFPEAAQGALEGVAGTGIDVKFPAAGRLPDGNHDADACALIAGVGRAGRPAAAAGQSAGREWARGAVMPCPEPGSTSETHSGNPCGARTAWTLPPWPWALPEYHKSMTSPFTLTAGSLHRSQAMTLPSRITCENPWSLARSSA